MTLTVTVTNEAFPEGQEFDIPGLGVFVNGVTTDIDEARERSYVERNMQTVPDGLKDSEGVVVSGNSNFPGGVKDVLGVDPSEISDVVEVTSPVEDVAEENADETATSDKVVNVGGTPVTITPPEPNGDGEDDSNNNT